jgi:hypothetical protein
MKKLMFAAGLCLLTSGLYAACVAGRFCSDDVRAYVNGLAVDGNGYAMVNNTVSAINASTPTFVGQIQFCTNCAGGGGSGTLCVSTSTTGGNGGSGSYFVLSTGTVCK